MTKAHPFSPSTIGTLKSGAIRDPQTPGLSLACEGGEKRWRYRRRIAGSSGTLRLTLGRYPVYSIADARKWAAALNADVEKGIDPRETWRRQRERADLTVACVHGRYMAAIEAGDWKSLKPRTIKDKAYIFRCDMAPIAKMCIYDVTSERLWELVEKKGDTSPTRANRLISELKVFFGWCSSRRGGRAGVIIGNNPASSLETGYYKENASRERFLDDEEISLFLRALIEEGVIHRRAMLLILLTGCRKLEVLEARVDEYRHGTWNIPAGRTKTRVAHPIALGPWGRKLFKDTDSEWVIPSRRVQGPMLAGWYKVLARIHERMKRIAGREIEHFTLHDLRRTVGSHIENLGISVSACDAMLNHAVPGMRKVYSRGILAEKGQGFQKWEEKVSQLAARSNLSAALDLPGG